MRVLKNIFLHFYKSSSDRSCSAEWISLQPLSVLRPVDSLVIYKRKSLINYWTGEWQGVGSIRFFLRRIVLCCFFQSRSVDVPLLQSNFPGCAFFSFSLFSSLVFHLHGVCKVWQESIETETQKVAFASLDKFNLLVHMVVATTYKMFEKISNTT